MNLEERLAQAFRDVADDARSIDTISIGVVRRRRHLSAVLAAAATVAVVLGSFGLAHFLLTGRGAAGPVQSPTVAATASATASTDTPTVTPSTPVPQKTVVVDPGSLATGAAPRIAYYEQPGPVHVDCGVSGWPAATGYIHPAPGDGPRIPVHLGANENFGGFIKVGSGYLAGVWRCSGTGELRRYASDGTVTDQSAFFSPSRPSFARGADGSVAVSLKPGQVTLFSASGEKLQTWTPKPDATAPLAVLADHSVLTSGAKTRLLLLPDGTVTEAPRVYRRSDFVAAHLDRVSGDVSRRTDCGMKVVDAQGQVTLWTDCGYDPGSFSPDGTVLAAAARGYASTDLLGFFDAKTGAQLIDFQATKASWNGESISYTTWEDDTHLLVLVAGPKAESLTWFRYGLDGSVEKVPLALPVGKTDNYADPRR